jgi:hypothetical protein
MMKMKMTRILILFCLLFDPSFKIASLSDAWAIVPPLPSSHRDTRKSKLWCRRHDNKSSGSMIDGEITISRSRRSMLLQLGSWMPVVGMAVTILAAPAAAEVDPFAAMDELLAGTSGMPQAFTSPDGGNSPTTANNPNKTTPIDSKSTSPSNTSPILKSDMAAALQESKKRKAIDPRTHG